MQIHRNFLVMFLKDHTKHRKTNKQVNTTKDITSFDKEVTETKFITNPCVVMRGERVNFTCRFNKLCHYTFCTHISQACEVVLKSTQSIYNSRTPIVHM